MSNTPSIRRFRYGQHTFPDPGTQYTVEQVKQHLVQFFPEIAHAEESENTLPDGTVEITFQKRVARKGSTPMAYQAIQSELNHCPPYEPLSLPPVVETREAIPLQVIHAHADLIEMKMDQHLEQVLAIQHILRRCFLIPPTPLPLIPHGF